MNAIVVMCLIFGQTPASELSAAVRDLRASVEPEHWGTTRYVSLAATPLDQRESAVAALSYTLNAVSRSSQLIRPQAVEGAGQAFVRIDLAEYAPQPGEVKQWLALWEALVSQREPYWHINAQVAPPETKVKTCAAKFCEPAEWKAKTKTGEAIEVFTDGGWVGLDKAAELRLMTGSAGAIVRGDWLVSRLTQPPFYYEFAGVPETRDGWFKRLGADANAIVALGANRGANLIRSGVTDKVRRISRWQGPLGGVWNTYDVAASTADQDFFRNPTFSAKFAAGEHIAARANGLHEFALFDAAGKRQNAVPANIGTDDTVHPAAEIIPMISCVRCHQRAVGGVSEDGLRSFRDGQSKLLAGRVELYAESPLAAQQLAAFYGQADRLQRELKRDREDYAAAVAQATGGLSPGEATAALGELFAGYVLRSVTPEAARRELGLAAKTPLHEVFQPSHDVVLLLLAEGDSVQRQQWEASFAEAALLAAIWDEGMQRPLDE